jgi:hypothetical protein
VVGNKKIIAALEQLLDSARDGEITGLAVVAVLKSGDIVTGLQAPKGQMIGPLLLGTGFLSERLTSGSGKQSPTPRIN